MLVHIIHGRSVIDPAGTEESHANDATNGIEIGGLLQAAVPAIDRDFVFYAPDGAEDLVFHGCGPFVEYIERVQAHDETGAFVRRNNAFLPKNAKQVFQSTMPVTRSAQPWNNTMRTRLNDDPETLFQQLVNDGWMRSARAMLHTGHVCTDAAKRAADRLCRASRPGVHELLRWAREGRDK